MKETCPNPASFDQIRALDPTDPQRRHLETCPQCRALCKAQAAFEAQPELSDEEESRCTDADEKLTALLNKTCIDSMTETSPPQDVEDAPCPFRPIKVPVWRQTRWLGAAAAVLVVCFGLWQVLPGGDGPSGPDTRPAYDPLRGHTDTVPETFAHPTVEHDQNGDLVLRWAPVTAAETYDVLFWSESLERLETVPTDSQTTLRFSDSVATPPKGAFFFCVIAWESQTEIGRSEMTPLP